MPFTQASYPAFIFRRISNMSHYVLLDDQKSGVTRYFENPVEIITAITEDDIQPAFEAIETHRKNGHYLAGYFSYELGYLLEPSLRENYKESSAPLLQIGVFEGPPNLAPADKLYTSKPVSLALSPKWSQQDYTERFETVKNYIEQGHVYQINLTFPMIGQTPHTASDLYAGLRRAQPGRYGGIVNLSDEQIISFSPELFFQKTNRKLRMRPMKGTRPRLSDAASDEASVKDMQAEPKSMAENLMIVDLLRNDLSRLCEPGSVKVPELFSLETYPTLHQMTSQVEGVMSKDTSWQDIFKGLFPCGSVTGAPKIRAMELISELENAPRGPYCGAIGYITPDNEACFNVAIRTLRLNEGDVRYDVGSGVVLDSIAEDEYNECLLKADILKPKTGLVFETLRWSPDNGYIRKDAHIARLLKAARAYRVKLDKQTVEDILKKNTPQAHIAQRIRLALNKAGEISFTASPLAPLSDIPLKLGISRYPLNKASQQTKHKVEQRDFYDGERARLKALHGIDEVIFLDEKERLCEGSFTSVFVEFEKGLFTPSLSGILPGVLRAEMVTSGAAKQKRIQLSELEDATAIYVGNSLRGLMCAELISLKRL